MMKKKGKRGREEERKRGRKDRMLNAE